MITQNDLFLRYAKGLDAVDTEMVELYGSRYLKYRKRYAQANRFQYEPKFPLYLMLEQTYMCNLKCPSCIHGLPEAKKRFNTDYALMPKNIFEKIIFEGEKHHCPSIAFHDNDEPLLVKDLANRVAFAKEHGFIDIFITTNGNLLDPGLIERLIKAGVTRILFSIDAATPETYKMVRPGGDFLKVIKNLKYLLKYKKMKKSFLPAIRVSFMPSRLNEHEQKLFIQIFSKKVDYVEIQGFSVYYGINKHLIPCGAMHVEDFRCAEPWVKLIIRANGDVLPCCSFYGYEIVLGNCLRTPIKDIFLGDECKKLRHDFKKGIYHFKPCQICSKNLYTMRKRQEVKL